MGALDTDSHQPSSAAATSNISDLKVHTPTSSDKVVRHRSGTKFGSFSSTSSSPDSTLDDPFLEFDIEHDESTSTITAVPKRADQASEKDKKASTDPQIPKPPVVTEHNYSPMSSPGYVFESPLIQTMERNNNSKYRIPSSVFARNKSTAPDWSMASNESLFSIQMGGMSFTQDHYNFFRSGELGLSGEPSTSGQKPGLSPAPSTSGQKPGLSGELSTPGQKLGEKATDVGRSQELCVGVPNENAEDRKSNVSNVDGRISHYSVESTSSTKSFAFPVLAGHEKDRANSARLGGSAKICLETPKLEQQAQTEEPKTPAAAEAQPKTPPAAPPVAPQNNWFSCFPCCS